MIYWIFGGTCVGKKRFIQQCLNPETRPEFIECSPEVAAPWFACGPCQENIVELAEGSDLFIRWQWGREETLLNILQEHPWIEQRIVVLSTTLMTQLSRVALREGCLKWDAEILHGEMRSVFECVSRLALKHSLEVVYVDSSTEQYSLRP
jgi:hypothetical protein